MSPMTNAMRNPRSINIPAPEGMLRSIRNVNSQQLGTVAIVVAQLLGFFSLGEMMGRLKVVGYHGKVHHEH